MTVVVPVVIWRIIWPCREHHSQPALQTEKETCMKNDKMESRRNFIKAGVGVAGMGLIPANRVYDATCDPETLSGAGPIPLNDVLASYDQINAKYGHGLKKVTICDKAGWENKKASVLRRAHMMLGEAPITSGEAVNAEILAEASRDGYKESKVQFPSGTGDMIKGYLLVPDRATPSRRLPAIIALHATGPGATQTVGITPLEGRGYGKELAQRGYVVLAIDTIAAGERVYPDSDAYDTSEFYRQYPNWSAMGKMIHDHQRGLDYLSSLDTVDPQRMGCIGHSLGGYNAFFLQAFDPRIKAAVSSCGLAPMGGSTSPYQFARNDWFVHFNPRCRDYIRAGMIPCDMHEFMALCAPRPLFNYSAKKDTIYYSNSVRKEGSFDAWWQTVDKAVKQIERLYDIHGKRDHFVRVEDDGGHDFPKYVRDKAYGWLDQWLGGA